MFLILLFKSTAPQSNHNYHSEFCPIARHGSILFPQNLHYWAHICGEWTGSHETHSVKCCGTVAVSFM